jgi:hypothetical protein
VTSAAVDAEGNIYLTGPAGENILDVGGTHRELSPKDNKVKKAACDRVYLAKLSPDAGKVLWLRTLKGASDAPGVSLDKYGKVYFQGPDLRTLTADGKQESVTVVRGGVTTRPGGTGTRTTAVNSRDGTFVRAGARPWPTGRESYRAPVLNVHKPDGKLLYELYNWDGPLVGLDNLRLVDDAAVRLARYDADGNLVLYAWGAGGNSVLYREPNDVRRQSKKMDGLGFSSRGGTAQGFAYLLKIDTEDYKVAGGTLWSAYLNTSDKPNRITIDSLGFAGDGSVCFAGTSAWGLIQTGNAVGKGEPAGPYVAVLSKDCSSLRFCSALPACGKTDVRDGARWGVAHGTLDGKPVALFLGGAVEEEEVSGKALPAPAVRPPQGKFGGGFGDGYLLLLDLSMSEKK